MPPIILSRYAFQVFDTDDGRAVSGRYCFLLAILTGFHLSIYFFKFHITSSYVKNYRLGSTPSNKKVAILILEGYIKPLYNTYEDYLHRSTFVKVRCFLQCNDNYLRRVIFKEKDTHR